MRRFLVWSVLGLFAIGMAGIGLSRARGAEGDPAPEKKTRAGRGRDANSPRATDVNRPGRGARGLTAADVNRPGAWGRALRIRIRRLEAVRQIAASEGATKTVAALEELIAEDKESLQSLGPLGERPRGKRGEKAGEPPRKGGPRGEGQGSGDERPRPKGEGAKQ